jgi:hypothetical protein
MGIPNGSPYQTLLDQQCNVAIMATASVMDNLTCIC